MKQTDYAPRAAAIDTYLTGSDLVGIEIGCDVGAHAEALLRYCSVKKLYLVDVWKKEFYKGYCMGRLHSQGFKNRVEMLHMDSHNAAWAMKENWFDFVYLDITHDYETVKQSLEDWWPVVKPKGLLGYRNYGQSNPGLIKAVNEYVSALKIRTEIDSYHGEIILFK